MKTKIKSKFSISNPKYKKQDSDLKLVIAKESEINFSPDNNQLKSEISIAEPRKAVYLDENFKNPAFVMTFGQEEEEKPNKTFFESEENNREKRKIMTKNLKTKNISFNEINENENENKIENIHFEKNKGDIDSMMITFNESPVCNIYINYVLNF